MPLAHIDQHARQQHYPLARHAILAQRNLVVGAACINSRTPSAATTREPSFPAPTNDVCRSAIVVVTSAGI
jgi:hypothetical protein